MIWGTLQRIRRHVTELYQRGEISQCEFDLIDEILKRLELRAL